MIRSIIFTLILASAISGSANDLPDSIKTVDTPPPDSTDNIAPAADSLTGVERARANFEARRSQISTQKVQILPRLSYSDSLTTYFLSSRQDKRSQIDRSYFHDA